MITKQSLIMYIDAVENSIKNNEEYIQKLYDLGIDTFESPLLQGFDENIKRILEVIADCFTSDDDMKNAMMETLEWYFYEYCDRVEKGKRSIETAEMFDEDDTPLCWDSDSLANYIIGFDLNK